MQATETENILMMTGLIIGLVLIVFIIAKYTYLIKRAIIEKGLQTQASSNRLRYLEIGCIVFGLGVGLLVSAAYTTLEMTEDTADLLVWGTILIFGSLGLLLAHFIRNKFER